MAALAGNIGPNSACIWLQLLNPTWSLEQTMAPKEPNRHQLSSRLSYSQNTPSFLLKLQNRIAGIPDEEEEYDEEFEDDGSGRPPIPRRPAIPERPEDDPGSADEDDGDEKPQVVVLREGKHLTEREAENVRRKGMSIHHLFFTRAIQVKSGQQKGAFHLSLNQQQKPLSQTMFPARKQ